MRFDPRGVPPGVGMAEAFVHPFPLYQRGLCLNPQRNKAPCRTLSVPCSLTSC